MGIQRVNRELKYFDRELYAVKSAEGLVQIYRKGVRWEYFPFEKFTLAYSRLNPHYVLSLTENWTVTGKPVEWGIEPLLGRLREIDSHNHDVLERVYQENEKRERARKQSNSNEIKARTYDLRRDFAKAVNDINTSTLEKVDSRRKKDAYCS